MSGDHENGVTSKILQYISEQRDGAFAANVLNEIGDHDRQAVRRTIQRELDRGNLRYDKRLRLTAVTVASSSS